MKRLLSVICLILLFMFTISCGKKPADSPQKFSGEKKAEETKQKKESEKPIMEKIQEARGEEQEDE